MVGGWGPNHNRGRACPVDTVDLVAVFKQVNIGISHKDIASGKTLS